MTTRRRWLLFVSVVSMALLAPGCTKRHASAPTASDPPASRRLPGAEAHVAMAKANIRRIFDASVTYYTNEFADRDGRVLPRQFPRTVGLTPSVEAACVDGVRQPLPPAPEAWSDPTWKSLGFSVDQPDIYRYEFVSTGTGVGAMFTARALGDLNCDGVYATFERIGVVEPDPGAAADP